MAHPIRVDNSQPVTARDTARTLKVSKKRTDELVREVRRILYRDSKTGEFVVRSSTRPGKTAVRSGNGNPNIEKANSTRRRVSR